MMFLFMKKFKTINEDSCFFTLRDGLKNSKFYVFFYYLHFFSVRFLIMFLIMFSVYANKPLWFIMLIGELIFVIINAMKLYEETFI